MYRCLLTGNSAILPELFRDLRACWPGHTQAVNSGQLIHQEVVLGQWWTAAGGSIHSCPSRWSTMRCPVYSPPRLPGGTETQMTTKNFSILFMQPFTSCILFCQFPTPLITSLITYVCESLSQDLLWGSPNQDRGLYLWSAFVGSAPRVRSLVLSR